MKPSLKSFEREEEEIEADFNAGFLTRRERDKAVKELWQEWKDIQAELLLRQKDDIEGYYDD